MSYTDGGDTSQDSENNPNIIPNGLDSILFGKGFNVLSGTCHWVFLKYNSVKVGKVRMEVRMSYKVCVKAHP